MKIGILTWLYNGNYGSILQAYALQNYLRNCGYDVENINYCPSMKQKLLNLIECKNSPSLFVEKWEALLTQKACNDKAALSKKNEKFEQFRESRFNLSSKYKSSEEIDQVDGKYDIYLCGSDQVWSPMLLNPVYFFDFLSAGCKKVAYACSFGMDHIPPTKQERIAGYIRDFSAISVREEAGKKIIKKLLGKSVTTLVDPTLLLSEQEWSEIAVTPNCKKQYVFCYFLSFRDSYQKIAKQIAKELNVDIVIVPTTKESYTMEGTIIRDAGPQDWVGLVKNAAAVVTDSFHGCVFSIVFKKNFYVLKRFDDSNPESQNSRIYTLLKSYSLNNCLIDDRSNGTDFELVNIDFDVVHGLLSNDVSRSKQWLSENLLDTIQETNLANRDRKVRPCSIEIIGKDACVGCGVCALVCPAQCISMQEDEEGFLHPKIDAERCIKCGACSKKCPGLHSELSENRQVFAAVLKDKEELAKCTSGGIFGALAKEYICNRKGIVYGAIFDGELNVRHFGIDNEKDLAALHGSKYVQSNTSVVFADIKEKLRQGREVLFSGTGCQIAALNNFLGTKYEKLLTVEVVCHGVPSPGLFRKYLKWLSCDEKTVERYTFRSKAKRPTGEHYKACYEVDGIKKWIFAYKDPYYSSFLNGKTLRPSCYQCRFKGKCRTADITIGDFWGIEKRVKNFPTSNGYSLVMVNTEQGETAFDTVKEALTYTESDYQFAIARNPAVFKAATRTMARYNLKSETLFGADLKPKYGIKTVAKNYVPWKVKNVLKRFI